MCTYPLAQVDSNAEQTSRVPDDLKTAIDAHPEINWSEVARQAMWRYVRKLEVAEEIASESELTETDAVELGEELKRDLAKHYQD